MLASSDSAVGVSPDLLSDDAPDDIPLVPDAAPLVDYIKHDTSTIIY